jgi:predicted PurR-regulated permease PerM
MGSETNKLIEHIFFFAVLGASAYLVWNLFSPFIGALALAAIMVTICYPMYERVLRIMPRKNATLASLTSLLIIGIVIITPLVILSSLILREAISIYTIFNSEDHVSFIDTVSKVEQLIQQIIPGFSLDISSIVQQTASFIVDHIVSLFAGTASTLFLFFIALIASFYFFRDGKQFTTYLIQLSPLKDSADSQILSRLAVAVRSVAVGTVSVAILQGVLTAVGLTLFGFDRAILWGCVAAIGALVPGVGTTIVFVPAVAYLFYTGAEISALLVALWGVLAVGLIDNIIGPYVMSRGNNVHPFLILLSVLGGIGVFGPMGFILGPVILSFFLVLLEIYHSHIKKSEL